jgi:hypothetical protein
MTDDEVKDALAQMAADGRRVLRKYLVADEHDRKGLLLDSTETGARPEASGSGERALSSDTEWKYVNVRRLFLFLEHSIDRGTQWALFEPNNEPL